MTHRDHMTPDGARMARPGLAYYRDSTGPIVNCHAEHWSRRIMPVLDQLWTARRKSGRPAKDAPPPALPPSRWVYDFDLGAYRDPMTVTVSEGYASMLAANAGLSLYCDGDSFEPPPPLVRPMRGVRVGR